MDQIEVLMEVLDPGWGRSTNTAEGIHIRPDHVIHVGKRDIRQLNVMLEASFKDIVTFAGNGGTKGFNVGCRK